MRSFLRLSSIMSTAIAMNAAVAHLMEMPSKRRYQPSLYVWLHRTLYRNFGRFAGPAEALALLTTSALAWRHHRLESTPSTAIVAAAGGLTAAHGIFWTVVNPVNLEMVQWPLDAIPDRWSAARDRWEFGHAVRACLLTGAFAALAWSLVDESSRRKEHDAVA